MNLNENINRIKQMMGILNESSNYAQLNAKAKQFYKTEVPISTDVVEVAKTWEGGGYNWGGGTGLSIPLMWYNAKTGKEELLKDKQEQGTYCSGYALQVGYIVARNRGLIDGKTKEQLVKFINEWYTSNPKTCVTAILNLGIGTEVNLDQSEQGDFCQLWRTDNSGHNVILLELLKNKEGEIIGLKYRSTQTKTNGIGDRIEYFSGFKGPDEKGKIITGKVNKNKIFFARLNSGNQKTQDEEGNEDEIVAK